MRIQRLQPESKPTAKEEPINVNLLEPLLDKYKGKKGSLIPLLQGTQEMFGYIPREAFDKISKVSGISLSDMYGVATFYAQFRLAPVGKYIIKVCHGTACHVQNADAISDAIKEALNVKDGETTEDKMFTLESVACLGCCSLAPVMMIGDEAYGKLTGNSAVKIIKDIKIKESQSN
ncbi:MAG: NADH-quinone oxidoreductase subunit NuoE [Bacteroidales bacterium]|nr:NADH-quinone oxidoreductase subunit NuoE [Bacteroidales bacterium]